MDEQSAGGRQAPRERRPWDEDQDDGPSSTTKPVEISPTTGDGAPDIEVQRAEGSGHDDKSTSESKSTPPPKDEKGTGAESDFKPPHEGSGEDRDGPPTVPQGPLSPDGDESAGAAPPSDVKTPPAQDSGDQGGPTSEADQSADPPFPPSESTNPFKGFTAPKTSFPPSNGDGASAASKNANKVNEDEDFKSSPFDGISPEEEKMKRARAEQEKQPKVVPPEEDQVWDFIRMHPGMFRLVTVGHVPITDPGELERDRLRESLIPKVQMERVAGERKVGSRPQPGYKFIKTPDLALEWRSWQPTLNPFDVLGLQPELFVDWRPEYTPTQFKYLDLCSAELQPPVRDMDAITEMVTKAWKRVSLILRSDKSKGGSNPLYPYDAEERGSNIKVDAEKVKEGASYFPYTMTDANTARGELLDKKSILLWTRALITYDKKHFSTWNPHAKKGTKGIYFPLPAYDVGRPDSEEMGVPDIIPPRKLAVINLSEMIRQRVNPLATNTGTSKTFDTNAYGNPGRRTDSNEPESYGSGSTGSGGEYRPSGGLHDSMHNPRGRKPEQEPQALHVPTDRSASQGVPGADADTLEVEASPFFSSGEGPSRQDMVSLMVTAVLFHDPYGRGFPASGADPEV